MSSFTSFAARVQAQNNRGVKTGQTLNKLMFTLQQLESMNYCDYKIRRLENIRPQIETLIAAMEAKEFGKSAVIIHLDNFEQMSPKVLRYRVTTFEIEQIKKEYNRRLSELQARLTKIEDSIPASQHGAFRLAIESAGVLKELPADIEDAE
jgi:hypothetical protein